MNQSKFRGRRVSNIRPLGSALIGPIRREQAGVYRNIGICNRGILECPNRTNKKGTGRRLQEYGNR